MAAQMRDCRVCLFSWTNSNHLRWRQHTKWVEESTKYRRKDARLNIEGTYNNTIPSYRYETNNQQKKDKNVIWTLTKIMLQGRIRMTLSQVKEFRCKAERGCTQDGSISPLWCLMAIFTFYGMLPQLYHTILITIYCF